MPGFSFAVDGKATVGYRAVSDLIVAAPFALKMTTRGPEQFLKLRSEISHLSSVRFPSVRLPNEKEFRH